MARQKRRRSPQERKRLSYDRDRRNVYGESPSSARRSIARRKRFRLRAWRRDVRLDLHAALGPGDIGIETRVGDLVGSRRTAGSSWRKLPDARLREVIAGKHARRAATGQNRPPAFPPDAHGAAS